LTQEVDQRARILSALAEPVRMAMVDHLLPGDASPGELGAHVGLGSNLLAHHLRVLEDAGVIRRVRSEGDRRRSYIQLRSDHPLVLAAAASTTGLQPAPRVVFICTANSARSQLAAATWNQLSSIPAASAGTHPGPRIHPRAVATAERHGLRLSADRPVSVEGQLHDGDLIVAVCDNAHEELGPDLPRLHWAVPDPVRIDTDAAFEAAYTNITRRVRHLTAVYPSGQDTDQKAS
jgi:ArsR family transcriptional regulator, arsenate/arsenite/antimonite-responsive transcriptional repressor / arsenate reductase (thioredoxin)